MRGMTMKHATKHFYSGADKSYGDSMGNKKGYVVHLEEETKKNGLFRRVLYTGEHSQLVLMIIKPKDELGMEVHEDNDQFFRIDSGEGKVIINGNEYAVKDGDGIVVPAGAQHNVMNTSAAGDLRLYTIYAPPHHKDGTVHRTKKDAMENEEEFEGKTTE
jgi:mannose-6-phosphate isomerase-like protein (cupin superfamily)